MFCFRPGPRPNPAKFQIPFLERLGLVEIQKSSEQEINLGFNTEIEEKMQINKEERNKKYDLWVKENYCHFHGIYLRVFQMFTKIKYLYVFIHENERVSFVNGSLNEIFITTKGCHSWILLITQEAIKTNPNNLIKRKIHM